MNFLNRSLAVAFTLLCSSGLFATAAQADSVLVYKHSAFREFRHSEFRFRDDGSAFLNLSFRRKNFSPRGGMPRYSFSSEKVSVSGLLYEADSARILYVTRAGAKVVCATVAPGKSFWGNPISVITPTGACSTYDKGRTQVWFKAE